MPGPKPAGIASRQFIVLGVHRSGTSVLTETAARLGLFAGGPDDLDAGDRWNERGYWEHRAVRNLDEELLGLASADWRAVSSFDPCAIPEAVRGSLEARAREVLDRLDEHAPWIVKDPRLCVLLPFWLPLLTRPAFLLSLRNPLSVARSLRARDGFPIPLGLALWETQLLAALAATRGRNRTAVWYENLLASPRREASRLARWLRGLGALGTDAPLPPPATDPRLKHHETDAAEERRLLPEGARRLLHALRAGVALHDDFDTSPSRDALEVTEFLAGESRTRRFLEDGWKSQRAAHGDAVRLLEEMIRTKDEYIRTLSSRLGDPDG